MGKRMGSPLGSRNNPNGRPKSDTVRLTKAARERFDRQLAEGIDDIFTALFEAGDEGQGHRGPVAPRQPRRADPQGRARQLQHAAAVRRPPNAPRRSATSSTRSARAS